MTDRPNTQAPGRLDGLFQEVLESSETRRETKEAQTAEDPIEDDATSEANGLAQLVLTVVRLLHEVLERQAIRRMENGSLTDRQIEEIGEVLMRQSEQLDRLCEEFELTRDDLEFPLDGIETFG